MTDALKCEKRKNEAAKIVDNLSSSAYNKAKISSNADWGWSKDPGPSSAGKFLAFFYLEDSVAKELSVFIDESGDFGEYDFRSPFYIITMVFHDQENEILPAVDKLNQELSYMRLNGLCIHTGPIIRREESYEYMEISERRRIFNKLVAFIRQVDIRYKCFYIEKKHIEDVVVASGKLSKQISAFIREHYDEFRSYDRVKIYYDNGQIEVTKIISSVFSVLLTNTEFRRVMPEDYKLFQVADLLCTMELVKLKVEHGLFSKSESVFFGNLRDMRRNYLRHLEKLEWK